MLKYFPEKQTDWSYPITSLIDQNLKVKNSL